MSLNITNTAFVSNYRRPLITSGLIGYYPLNECVGINANDLSGNNPAGLLVGSPTWTNGSPVVNGLKFGGVTAQYVSSSNFCDNLPNFSACCWFQMTSGSAFSHSPLVCKVQQGNGGLINGAAQGWFIGFYLGQLAFALQSFTTNTSFGGNAGPSTLDDGQWHHAAMTVQSGSTNSVKGYVDGIQYLPTSFDGPTSVWGPVDSLSNTNVVGIASEIDSAAGDALFTGSITDVRIYNRVLAASEVSLIYNLEG